jgi:Chromosome segregation ATPases
LQDIEVRLASAKSELERLGNVNMMAPAAYDQKSKDVEEVTNKLIVLENEKSSIMNMISELEDKKVSVFNRTFESVNKYFQQLYSRSMGVYAHLELENPKDIFESGLSIKIAPKDGGAEHSSDQMSGGEKAFALLILIFAILMQNPLQFYIFDEIDASLDKENSKKLSNLIKEMGGSKSQFLVVSHNDSMIAGADTAIGVVKQNNESKVVGIQLVGLQNK